MIQNGVVFEGLLPGEKLTEPPGMGSHPVPSPAVPENLADLAGGQAAPFLLLQGNRLKFLPANVKAVDPPIGPHPENLAIPGADGKNLIIINGFWVIGIIKDIIVNRTATQAYSSSSIVRLRLV